MGKINTVIFDIGNVLTDFCWEQFIMNKGYSQEMMERISRASIHTKEWNELDRGIMKEEDVVELFIQKDPEIKDAILHVFQDLSGIISEREYAIPWVNELKSRGYQVLVLSNFPGKAHVECKDQMKFLDHVDGGILSYQDQLIKPDPAIYQLLLKRYDLNASQCVFIDDLEKNIQAGKEQGINGIQFISREQVIEELENLLSL